MSEWQEIESLFNNSSFVDLWVVSEKSGAEQRVADCYRGGDGDFYQNAGQCLIVDFPNYRPTHWMPKPLPPLYTKESKNG